MIITSNMSLNNCSFSKNSANEAGAALYIESCESVVIIMVDFTFNIGGWKGVIFIYGKKGKNILFEKFICSQASPT